MSSWSTVRQRAQRRWQIPLLAFALAMMGVAVLRVRPTPDKASIDEVVAQMRAMLADREYERTIWFGLDRLKDERRSDEDRAWVYLYLGRARADLGEQRPDYRPRIGELALDHFRVAEKYGLEFDPQDSLRFGRAFEWQGAFAESVRHYERAVSLGVPDALDLRRHVLELREYELGASAEDLNRRFDGFLADVGDERLDLRLWALERKMDLLDDLGATDRAATLLTQHRGVFEGSSLYDRFGYLEALLFFRTGEFDQAERYLRTIRNRASRADEVYGMTGWLLGRVVLSDSGPQRPQEALSFFSDVIDYRPQSVYATASHVGRGEALWLLGRNAAAIDAFKDAIRELPRFKRSRVIGVANVRNTLGMIAGATRIGGDLRAAIGYAELAATLLDPSDREDTARILQQLARFQGALADNLFSEAQGVGEGDEARAEELRIEVRALAERAAERLLELAAINMLDDVKAAEASWQAANRFEQAGRRRRAAELFRAYASKRPGDYRVPSALFRAGDLLQRQGALSEAIEVFRECADRFPRMMEGSQALIHLARCYRAEGPRAYDQVEKTLHLILDDPEGFTPEAPVYAEALFLLGDVLARRGDFEQAIAKLEEWLGRYEQRGSVDLLGVRFLLADSYRQSGLSLKREMVDVKFTGERAQMQQVATQRLTRAGELYRTLVDEYEARPIEALSRLERVYQRLSHLYEGDCLFEMQQYNQALKLYQEAAGSYQDSPSALGAYVQIINCHVFLGQLEEARAALARALILVDRIPESAFDESISPVSREDSRRYFEWLGASGLF